MMVFSPLRARSSLPVLQVILLTFLAATCSGAKNFPKLPVLGYVTPWNSRGKDLVEQHRSKFDIISPVWYTVHALRDDKDEYEVRGGPPSEDDEEWYRRLQKPERGAAAGDNDNGDTSSDSSAAHQKILSVAPRFLLDGWSQDDYLALWYNQTRWAMLNSAIMKTVSTMSFNGIVLESGVLMPEPTTALAASLHAADKILIIVSRPLRTGAALGNDEEAVAAHWQEDSRTLQSVAALAGVADFVSIMTYDMHGPGGRLSTGIEFPERSPGGQAQTQGKLREPGSNTNADWARENLQAFIEEALTPLEALGKEEQQVVMDVEGSKDRKRVSTTFLPGLPLYGYAYPIIYIDQTTGMVRDPARGLRAFDKSTVVAALRGAGNAITMVEIRDLLEEFDVDVEESEDGEYYFDYVKEDGWWRVFTPAPESMTRVLETVNDLRDDAQDAGGGVGISLWEVGQSTNELLEAL